MSFGHIRTLHVVRRYGPVGGMERYVWELTQHLAAMGCQVAILCESVHATPHPSIAVHALGSITRKPRWLAALRFSGRASRWLKLHPHTGWLIHSHETTGFHHVATFHGPPFAHVRQRAFWRNMSMRVQANLWLEQRFVCAASVQAVIPNSDMIREQLHRLYPCIGKHMALPIVPGVEDIPKRLAHTPPAHGGVVGVVGKEWKRKGLDIAVEIVGRMRQSRPQLELHVAGPKPEDVRHLFSDWQDGYRLLGETDAKPLFQNFDLLLHPARMEPFGMVVTEALSADVPVVLSKNCGAQSEVQPGRALALDARIDDWAQTCLAALGQPQGSYQRSWREVAEEHCQLYGGLGRHAD